MRIQDRDIEILKLVNSFGFLTIKILSAWCGVHYSTMQKRIQKITNSGLLVGEHILWLGEKVFKLTKHGCNLIQDDLKPLAKINLGTFLHDMKFLDLALHLKQTHSFRELIPERRQKHISSLSGREKTGHAPDGLIIFEDGKRVAVELELTVKKKLRMDKILSDFYFFLIQISLVRLF